MASQNISVNVAGQTYSAAVSIGGGVPNPTGWYSVKAYGAVGDGVTNDTTAIQAAIDAAYAAGGGNVLLQNYTYAVGSALNLKDYVCLRGAGKGATTLKRTFTGNMFSALGSWCQISDMTIDGDTATRGAGKGIVVTAPKFGQIFTNVNMKNFVEPCLYFGADAGSQFRAIACDFYTTGAQGSVGAVTMAGPDTAAIPRHFFACESSGCTLYDFGGSLNAVVHGGYTNCLIFGDACQHVFLTDVRIGTLGGSVTVKGASHRITSCIFALPVVIDADNTFFSAEVPDADITGSGVGNEIYAGTAAYTPAWTSSGTAPAIGNGLVRGLYTRQGRVVVASFEIYFGSTTTPGTGTWYISLPILDTDNYVFESGSGRTDGSTTTNHNFVCQVVPGAQKVALYSSTSASSTAITGTTQAWATDTTIRGVVQYFVP